MKSTPLKSSELRIFRSFAEAIAPEGGPLPAAEKELAVVDRLQEFLGHTGPQTLKLLRLALHLVEWSTFPRRFSQLPVELRSQKITKLEKSRVSQIRNLVLLPKTPITLAYAQHSQVQAAVGAADARCAVREGYKPPLCEAPPLTHSSVQPVEQDEECDVVIVGSGAGGATAALTLAEAGLSVRVLEEGEYVSPSESVADPLQTLPKLYQDAGFVFAVGNPPLILPTGRCVGGTTVLNSGTCFRAPDEVLESWRDEFGIAWATELSEQFQQVERDLHVTEIDPDTMGRNGQLCMEGAEKLGYSGGPISRNAGAVCVCSACPTGCPLGAKQATHVNYLPRAVAAGARIHSLTAVERIEFEGRKAVGVVTKSGHKVKARTVVLAAGAVGTPVLLLKNGFKGEVGRHLHVQPACWVGAHYSEAVNGWDGIMQSYYVDQWRDSMGIFLEATATPLPYGAHWIAGAGTKYLKGLAAYGNLGIIGVHLADFSSEGRVRVGRNGRPKLSYKLTKDEAEKMHFALCRAAEIHFAAGAEEVYSQYGTLPPLKPGEISRLEHAPVRRSNIKIEGFHPMGTCRMAKDGIPSAVDPEGRVKGTESLYVMDASVLPTSLGTNPMVTIMATTTYLAEQLAKRMA